MWTFPAFDFSWLTFLPSDMNKFNKFKARSINCKVTSTRAKYYSNLIDLVVI